MVGRDKILNLSLAIWSDIRALPRVDSGAPMCRHFILHNIFNGRGEGVILKVEFPAKTCRWIFNVSILTQALSLNRFPLSDHPAIFSQFLNAFRCLLDVSISESASHQAGVHCFISDFCVFIDLQTVIIDAGRWSTAQICGDGHQISWIHTIVCKKATNCHHKLGRSSMLNGSELSWS